MDRPSHKIAVHSESCQNPELRNRSVPIVHKSMEEKKNHDKENKEVVVEKEAEKESEVKE